MISLLMDTMLRSLVLGIAVALALCIFRVRSPHLQKSAWTAVLVSALVMPLLMRAHGVVIHAPGTLTLTLDAVGPAAASATLPGLAAVYCAVALLMCLRFIMGITRLLRIRRRARRVVEPWAAGLDVRVAGELSGPATFGATILLPPAHVHWNTQKRRAIMAHERAHVLSHDCQRLWLARLYTCVFWLNPLAWWLERRIASLAEETSDAAALQVVGDAPAYAEILLEVAAVGGRVAAVAMGMSSRIASRIERIVDGKAARGEPRTWRRFAAAIAIVPAMLLCATLQFAPSQLAFPQARTRPSKAHSPRILGWPNGDQLSRFFPAKARRAGVDGSVTLAVTLDDAGRPMDARVLGEAPHDFGFGAAATSVAHLIRYSNPTGHPAQVEFRIKFALHHGQSPARPSP
jgi:TonB family protein